MLAPSLKSFLTVAERGSVSRAAESLHLTQPAVTKQIRALEASLGVMLIERTGRGVRLTEAGELLADYGRRTAGVLQECRQALADLQSGERGKLTLGAGVTTCIFNLPPWLRQFRKDRPNVDITVRTGTSQLVAQYVLDRETELGLVTSHVSSAQLEIQPLFSEGILLVASPDFVVPRHPTCDDIPLILFPPSTGFRQYLNDKVGTGILARQVKMETDSVEAIKSFVMMGLGGSFLPASSVKRELAARRLKQLRVSRVPPLSRTTSVLHRRDRRLGAAAQSFLRVISGAAGSR